MGLSRQLLVRSLFQAGILHLPVLNVVKEAESMVIVIHLRDRKREKNSADMISV